MEQTEQKQTNIAEQDWLKTEKESVNEKKFDGERLPSLKMEEGKITIFEVDFSKPFDKWTSEDGVTKKIIPVVCNGEKMNFWLNVRNPLYAELINKGAEGVKLFKVMRTGQATNTRYSLVKE